MPLPMYGKNQKNSETKQTKILAIAAGKGGVGKSTVSVNLGLALKSLGYSVGIMDTDIYGPSLRKMLPEERMPQQVGDKIIPALCSGMPMISMAYFRKENEASVVRAPIANNIIMQFVSSVEWGPLDYLLIDFPPGTGDIQLTLSQKANISGAIMVTTPQDVAVMDVRKAMHMFDQVNIPIIGIVENMSYFLDEEQGKMHYIFGEGGGERLAEEATVPFLGKIPLFPALCRYGDAGQSPFNDSKPSPIKDAFVAIAENIVSNSKTLSENKSDTLQNFELNWKDMAEK